MALQILLLPDKFKGTMTASQAAEAMARGWRSARPEDRLELLPISDGGDGFGQLLGSLLQAAPRPVKTVDAAHRACDSVWWWHEPSRTAIIESAQVIGLAQLPAGKYHPFELDTEGLGAVLQAAARAGAARCLVGVGGSATNDGGFGLARALGWQFFNPRSERLARWTGLHHLSQVRPPERIGLFDDLTVAVDVQNPLLGERGCTRIYGPQKGLRPEDFEFAERCLERMTTVLAQELHLDYAAVPGAGAAGGLGYGLRTFAAGKLQPGFTLFSSLANLTERIRSAQLVLTGEGAIDQSSLMGKGVGEVASLCRRLGVPCIGLAGAVSHPEEARRLFAQVHALTPDFVSVEEAMARPQECLARLTGKVGREFEC